MMMIFITAKNELSIILIDYIENLSWISVTLVNCKLYSIPTYLSNSNDILYMHIGLPHLIV